MRDQTGNPRSCFVKLLAPDVDDIFCLLYWYSLLYGEESAAYVEWVSTPPDSASWLESFHSSPFDLQAHKTLQKVHRQNLIAVSFTGS